MRDAEDNFTLELKDDEVFEQEEMFDPYKEYGVSVLDFTWYGTDPATIK